MCLICCIFVKLTPGYFLDQQYLTCQGASCALVVGPGVYAGVPLEPLVFNPMVEPPSVPTTKHAWQLATNVPPVRPTSSCFL